MMHARSWTPRADTPPIADAIPGARFDEFPGASHAVTLHYPEEINRRLVEFLDAVEASLY